MKVAAILIREADVQLVQDYGMIERMSREMHPGRFWEEARFSLFYCSNFTVIHHICLTFDL